MREANRFIIFNPCLLLVTHQGVGVSEADLRSNEVRVNFQRGAVMLQRSLKVSSHAQEFAVGVLWVRFFGKQYHVTIHSRKSLVELPVAGVDIGEIVQRRGKIL